MLTVYMTRDNLEELVINTLKIGATMEQVRELIEKLNIKLCD